MKKNKIIIAIMLIIAMVLSFVGCAKPKDNFQSIEVDGNFYTKYERYLSNSEYKEAIALLNVNIVNYTPTQATKFVMDLIVSLKEDIERDEKYKKLVEIAAKYNVNDDNIDSFFDGQHDANIAKQYIELRDSFRKIRIPKNQPKVNYFSYIDVDFIRIRDAFEDYITPELSAFLDLNEEEYLYLGDDSAGGGINYDVALSNILLLENYVEKYPYSAYTSMVKDNLAYHYQSYLGYLDWGMVYNSNNTLARKARSHYEMVLDEYPDSSLAKRIVVLFEALEKEGNRKTSNIHVLLMDITEISYEGYSTKN